MGKKDLKSKIYIQTIKKGGFMAAVSNWKLPEELVALSVGKSWPGVLKEWKLSYVEFLEHGEESETCLCHHYPIREVCHITNIENDALAIVGNCCITKFGDDESVFAGTHKIFDAFKRIQKDVEASANKELIEYAYNKGAINDKGYQFYVKIWRKRKLTGSQLGWKRDLNRKIIRHITSSKLDTQKVGQIQNTGKRTLQEAFGDSYNNPATLIDQRLIKEVYEKKLITKKDYDFYNSLFDRNVTRPTKKQRMWIKDINRKILRK